MKPAGVIQRPVSLAIVGAQKAGTTTLLRCLGQHPQSFTHAHRSEMNFFFDEEEYLRGYVEAFPDYFGRNPKGSVAVAKHVLLMYFPEALQRLRGHNPGIHVVALLRNPVQRAYSAYWYARRMGWEHLESFDEALDAEKTRLEEDRLKWAKCAYVANGIYHPHIAVMFEMFGKEKVSIYLTDDLSSGLSDICQALFGLLGMDHNFVPDIKARHNISASARSEALSRAFEGFVTSDSPAKRALSRIVPKTLAHRARHAFFDLNKKASEAPPMENDVRDRLLETFGPHNARLGALIGRDIRCWDR